MVKNINAFHLTEKIRFGRHTSETQPENTIVLNASSSELRNLRENGFYVSPIRDMGTSSNVLMYDVTRNEIVVGAEFSLQGITELGSTSNVKTSFKHLEVEQLDVINVTTINSYYIENPEFVIGRSDCDIDRSTLKMVRGDASASIDYDGKLTITSDTIIDGSLKANVYHGDGGILSNLSYDQLGYTMPKLCVTNDVIANKYYGDGSALTGLTLEQVGNVTSDHLTMKSARINEEAFIGRDLFVNGSIQSENVVYGKVFVGDGRRLSGVALTRDLVSNTARIEALELLKPEIAQIDGIVREIPKIHILENNVRQLQDKVKNDVKHIETFESDLKHIPQIVDKNLMDIQTLQKKAETLETFVPTVEKSKVGLDIITPIVEATEKRVTTMEKITPRVQVLESKVAKTEALIPSVHTHETYGPRIERLEPIVDDLVTYIPRIVRVDPFIQVVQAYTPKVDVLEKQVQRFIPLEAMVSNVYSTEKGLYEIQKQVPKIDERLKILEVVPPPSTLQSITSEQSNTTVSVQFEHPELSLMTMGNVGIGTTEASSRISIFEEPNILTDMGEVRAIHINNLIQINAYTKANNGTSSGRPGGLVIKTKRPNGEIQESMTIDGNGCVTIGSNSAYPSAALAVDSTTRGMLLPRLTTEQILKIKKPEPGLMVYNTEDDEFWAYKRGGWGEIKSSLI